MNCILHKKKQPVIFQNYFSVFSWVSQGQTQNTSLHFNTVVGKGTVELPWRIISLRMRVFHLAENSEDFIMGWSTLTAVGRNYT